MTCFDIPYGRQRVVVGGYVIGGVVVGVVVITYFSHSLVTNFGQAEVAPRRVEKHEARNPRTNLSPAPMGGNDGGN